MSRVVHGDLSEEVRVTASGNQTLQGRGGGRRRCSADTGAGGNRHEDRRSKVRIGGVERGAVIKSD